MSNKTPLRVAIVDDHPMFRMGMAVAISDMADIELVGEAESVEQVPDLIATASPDVVLLDVRLGEGSGLEVNRWLAEYHSEVRVVLLTMSEDHDTMATAVRDGARGYLVKGAGPERVEHAVWAAASGAVVLDPDLALAVTERAQTRKRNGDRPFPHLTERQFEVLGLMAEGMSNGDIKKRLVLSEKTVRNHVSGVLRDLPASDRAQAIVIARRAGLGEPDG